ncbi:3-mercaptopyruvate sulfurtransferase [Vibrio ishigakensis]|uniref:3-mercaptopyruvate sulfurtransferase n=1 Tax=Vibrio ishigakensis TaxID=1481914 RepID=A0A0B8QDF1_9VIBR|nr:3-mercaptopyruvate sulfurtransferase [Vibrio ishigakensis]
MNQVLVDVNWLAEHKNEVILLDAFMLKVVGKEPIEYDKLTTIPGALAFDIETDFCDFDSTQLHAMPTTEQFTQKVRALGLTKTLAWLFLTTKVFTVRRELGGPSS